MVIVDCAMSTKAASALAVDTGRPAPEALLLLVALGKVKENELEGVRVAPEDACAGTTVLVGNEGTGPGSRLTKSRTTPGVIGCSKAFMIISLYPVEGGRVRGPGPLDLPDRAFSVVPPLTESVEFGNDNGAVAAPPAAANSAGSCGTGAGGSTAPSWTSSTENDPACRRVLERTRYKPFPPPALRLAEAEEDVASPRTAD